MLLSRQWRSASPSPSLAQLTSGLAVSLRPGVCPRSCSRLRLWRRRVLLPPKTWLWACCQPQARLSCSAQLGSCLRFHFPLSSPWPARLLSSSCDAMSPLQETSSPSTADLQDSEFYSLPSATLCKHFVLSAASRTPINREKSSRLRCIRLF